MEMTPLDIRNQEFRRKTFGGLDPEEVQAFLSHLASEYESRLRESQDASDKLIIAKEQITHYRSLEGTLQETALTLQKILEEKKVQAQKEAEFIIAEAKNNAYKETEAIRRESENLRTEIVGLRAQKTAFFSRIRNALRTQEELLEAMEKDYIEHDAYDAELKTNEVENTRQADSQGRLKRQAVRDIHANGPGIEGEASSQPAQQAQTLHAPAQPQVSAPAAAQQVAPMNSPASAAPQVRRPTPGVAPARRPGPNPGPSELPNVSSTGIQLNIDQPPRPAK